MTTKVKIATDGHWQSTVKLNGVDLGTVGPGPGPDRYVEKTFVVPHGQIHQIEVEEKPFEGVGEEPVV